MSRLRPVQLSAPIGKADDKRYYEDMFLKPLITAGVGSAVSKVALFGKDRYIRIRGTSVPLWAITFGALYVAGVAGEVVGQKVLPHVPREEKGSDSVLQAVVQPAAVGLANGALWNLATSAGVKEKGLMSFMAVGALSEVAGDYIYLKFVIPAINK